jgi:hypothetical protein
MENCSDYNSFLDKIRDVIIQNFNKFYIKLFTNNEDIYEHFKRLFNSHLDILIELILTEYKKDENIETAEVETAEDSSLYTDVIKILKVGEYLNLIFRLKQYRYKKDCLFGGTNSLISIMKNYVDLNNIATVYDNTDYFSKITDYRDYISLLGKMESVNNALQKLKDKYIKESYIQQTLSSMDIEYNPNTISDTISDINRNPSLINGNNKFHEELCRHHFMVEFVNHNNLLNIFTTQDCNYLNMFNDNDLNIEQELTRDRDYNSILSEITQIENSLDNRYVEFKKIPA